MIFLWLCFLEGQTIPDTLGSAFPATDTVRVDSLPADSTVTDTMPEIFPVPVIVQYRDQDPDNAGFLLFHPRPYDLFFDDLLQSAGMLTKNGRLVTRGRALPSRAEMAWDSRILTNRLFGSFDIRLIPPAFLESMAVADGNAYLHSRINRFDRPYSHIRFTTLGNTTLYNLDLTRAISNSAGFYISGVYSKHRAAASDSEETRNAFYGNFYTCGALASRLDLIYSDRNLPGSGKGSLYDASLTLGRGQVRTRLSYDYQLAEYDNYSARSRDARVGFEARGDHELELYRFLWTAWFNADDILTRGVIPSDYNERDYTSGIGLYAERRAGRFRIGAGGRIETAFDGTLYPMPGFRINFAPADSMEIFASLDRGYRRPSVVERLGYAYAYEPDYLLRPSPGLEDEYSWRADIGYIRKNIAVTAYREDFTDYIRYVPPLPGLDSLYDVQNIPGVSLQGIDLNTTVPLIWGFSIGASGNYLFQHEDGSCPDYSVHGTLSWLHEHGRARYEVSGWGRYIGGRYGFSNGDGRPVLYAAAAVRFIALTASLRFENILDDTISDFTVPPRNISLSIQWEFWN